MDDPTPDPTTRTPTPTPPASSWGAPPPPPPPVAPGWPAPPGHRHDHSGRTASVVTGLILLAIGLWYFAERTLGLVMPHLDWARLWPLILVAVGVAIIAGEFRRR
jgi:hypothetical protein